MVNPLQFLSESVAGMKTLTENINRSRTASTENQPSVSSLDKNNTRYRSRSSEMSSIDDLIDVDEISSISSDSEKHSAWLLPEGTTKMFEKL